MKFKAKTTKKVLFISLFLLFSLAIYFNTFSHLRSTLTDNLHGNQKPLENIVIIKIDDQSINSIGRWPWDRDVFARLLNKIQGAKAIGVDVSFFEPSNQDEALSSTLSNLDNVILAAEINNNILYTPIFNTNYGYVNLATDIDGVTRKIIFSNSHKTLPFSFKIYKTGWDPAAEFNEGIYHINFISTPNSFNSLSVLEVLENDFDFSNKFVFIGATAPNLHDEFFVPTSKGKAMPGVEIQATLLQNTILDNFLEKQSKLSIILFVFISLILSIFLLSRIKIQYSIPLIILILVLYVYASILIFSSYNYELDLFFFPISLLVFTGTGIGLNYIQEKRAKRYIRSAFGKYISKDLLNEIINKRHELKLGGEKRTVSIFFSDIRGFTSISEKLSPEGLVTFINQYLTNMTEIILEHKGTVDKFIGDAILAFWNAPLPQKNHALLSCQSAIAQIKALEELNKSIKKLPKLAIGCGINTGEAVIGNMGSENRFDYTAMGDTVNIASRLEGLTKHYGVSIIISEHTYKEIKDKLTCRKLDAVKVKGKKLPIIIYELCIKPNKKFISEYEKAFELYLKGDFRKALNQFKKALKLKPSDTTTKLMIDRCKIYIKHKPKKWDGSFTMTSK